MPVMKRFLAGACATVLLVLPAFAADAPMDEAHTSLRYLLARFAALSAEQPVWCTILTSKSTVRVQESFTFLWFSTGMNRQVAPSGRPALAPFDVITIALDKPGTWEYTLKLYDSAGAEVPCSAKIHVLPA